MSRFDRAFLNQVLARTSIIDVIGKKVTWDKKKSNMARGDYWACCPFHGEKSPSFHATESKGQYHCFGCGVHGNAFDFIMEMENLGFSEAVERLAQIAGIEVPKQTQESREAASKNDRIMKALDEARKLYSKALYKDEGAIARAYLKKRGIPESDWEVFGLGYSPNINGFIRERLSAQGMLIEDLVDAGLLRNNDNGAAPYDLYRNRLMFAIEDAQGKTISFGARTLDPDGMPKYINGPESPVFSKGFNLYRYNIARSKARENPLIIAEGYMDVIALERAGFAAVAPLGTALTEDQLKLAWRASSRPILCFDGDSAGKRAAGRALERALPLINTARSLGFVTLPEGQDPDDIIKIQGRGAIAQMIDEAQDMAHFIFQNELAQFENLDNAEARAKLRAALREKNNEIKDEDLKAEIRIEIKSLFDARFGRNLPKTQIENRPNTRFVKKGQVQASQELIAFAGKKKAVPKGQILNIIGAPIFMPQLLDRGEEGFALLELDDKGLDSLRHGILDVFHSQNNLDFSVLKHHFTKAKDNLALGALELLQKQPFNPYAKKGAQLEDVFNSWTQAIEKISAIHALEKDAHDLQASAGSDGEASLLRLSKLVTERRRLNSTGGTEN